MNNLQYQKSDIEDLNAKSSSSMIVHAKSSLNFYRVQNMDEDNQLLFLANHQHEIRKVRKWNINKAQGGKSIDAMEGQNYWDFELESANSLYAVCE